MAAHRKVRSFAAVAVVAVVVALTASAAGAGTPEPDQTKIVGGTESSTGAWPSMVAILQSAQPDNFQAQFCGGTLVNAKWVLTAAHCMFRNGTKLPASAVDVLVGTQDLDSGGTRIRVAEIRVLPGWDPNTKQRDLAMLRLSKAATQPVQALPAQGSAVPGGTAMVATGWGMLREGVNEFPARLRQVGLYQVSDSQCAGVWGSRFTASSMTCAYADAKDTCQGDSGGPLVVRRNNAWVQVGITSFGVGCANDGIPGIYTRVASFSTWIRQQIGGTTTPPPTGTITISARFTATKVTVGTRVEVYGAVTPKTALSAVVLQRYVNGRWVDRGVAKVDTTTGGYRVAMRPSAKGVYSMRLRSTGGSVISKTIFLKVT